MNTLREMVDFASPLIAERFAKHGMIYPMWHVVRGDGNHEIKTDVGPDKDAAAILMRAYFMLVRARRYLFIDEAWMAAVGLDRAETVTRYASQGRLSEFPDRREAVMFSGEDRNGDSIMGVRYILRPEHGKPTLAPLEIQDRPGVSYGRFVNMLHVGEK
jgi:hypothetical protein